MFPIKDDNPHYLTPVVTYALIGLNVAAWVLVISTLASMLDRALALLRQSGKPRA